MEEVRRIRGNRLTAMMRAPAKIPTSPGVYIWRYWPTLKDLTKDNFLEMLQDWQSHQPQFQESLANSRVKISMIRMPFGGGGHQPNTILGLDVESTKAKNLLAAFENDEDACQILAYTLECIISAGPPLYIGKADNLRKRLSDHFERRTDVLRQIAEADIAPEDVYISYIIDPYSTSDTNAITTALEEIIQRITNPPFTKRIG